MFLRSPLDGLLDQTVGPFLSRVLVPHTGAESLQVVEEVASLELFRQGIANCLPAFFYACIVAPAIRSSQVGIDCDRELVCLLKRLRSVGDGATLIRTPGLTI